MEDDEGPSSRPINAVEHSPVRVGATVRAELISNHVTPSPIGGLNSGDMVAPSGVEDVQLQGSTKKKNGN